MNHTECTETQQEDKAMQRMPSPHPARAAGSTLFLSTADVAQIVQRVRPDYYQQQQRPVEASTPQTEPATQQPGGTPVAAIR